MLLSWSSKGTTNKMPLASQTKKQDKMTAFSPYWSETTASYDRAKNFKRVFSERWYSGRLAASRKTVEQGFNKRESLWKRRGGAVEGKEKSFSRKGSFPLPRLSAGGEATRKEFVPAGSNHQQDKIINETSWIKIRCATENGWCFFLEVPKGQPIKCLWHPKQKTE